MNFKLLIPATVLLASSIAFAHGVQTQLTYDAVRNQIDTRSIIYTSANGIGQPVPINTVTAARRAYVMPLLYSPIGAGAGWYARPDGTLNAQGVPNHPTGPGPAWQYNDLLTGTGWSHSGSATLPNLQGTAFSYKLLAGLKQWDASTSTFVDPGSEQVQIILGDGTGSFTPTATNQITTRDAAPFGSLTAATIGASKSANPHASISVRLLGDGATLAPGDDGVYLVTLALSTTASVSGNPVGDSDPFYFLLTKNVATDEARSAAAALGLAPSLVQTQVPEPTTLVALGSIAVLLMRRRPR